jgi:hypothetical protein
MKGYSNEELMRQHMEQKAIMANHEDYAALRPKGSHGKVQHVTLKDVDSHWANTAPSITYVVNMCKPGNNSKIAAEILARYKREKSLRFFLTSDDKIIKP